MKKKFIQTDDVIRVVKEYFRAAIDEDRQTVDTVDACVDICNEITRLALTDDEPLGVRFVGDFSGEKTGGVFG